MNNISDALPVATVEQFRAALLAVRQRMTDVQLRLLQAHCRAADHTISLNDLTDVLRLENWSSTRNAYRNYARLIAEALRFVPGSESKKAVWLCAIAHGQPDADSKMDGDFQWTMRP